MDQVLQSLPIQLTFRGILPGGFLVLSFLVAVKGWEGAACFALSKHGPSPWLLGLSAIFFGIVVYTIHRALIYPLIEWGLCRPRWKVPFWKDFHWPPYRFISDEACDELLDHWTIGTRRPRVRIINDSVAGIIGKHNTSWNDYVHLHYASAVCIGLGAILGSWFAKNETQCDLPLTIAGAVLLISGLLGDIRRRRVMMRFLTNYRDLSSPTSRQKTASG
jgi:hypothetical protein